MKKYQYLLGLCIAALLMPVLSSCEDDSLFFRTGNMSKLAFVVGTADDEAPKASTRGVVHVVDYFVDEEGDTLYLACRISDMDQPAVTDSAVTRATPISASSTDNTLASVYGQFNVSAYKDGKVSRPLKETDEDGNELTNAKSYVGVTFSARMTTGGTQQTDGTNPVWELTSGGSDNFCWPKNGSLTFYTFAPTTTVKSGPSWTGLTPADNYKDGGVIEFDYTVPSNKTNSDSKRVDAEEQPDILVSSVNVKRSDVNEYEESTDTKYVVVPLTLYHALCAVEFKVNASTATEDQLKKDVTVTSVSLGNLKGSGTCTFNPSATTGSGSARYISWDFTDVTDNTGNYSQTYNFENDDPDDEDLKASIGTAAQTFMLIPQTVGGGSTATDSDAPDASITLGYKTAKGTAKTKSVDLHKDNAYTWKAGKKYTYYLTGDLASLTLDGSLLTWGMNSAPLGLRHYVLTVTGPGGSDPVLTYNDPTAAQNKLFNVKSYYYEGEDDTDADERTAVTCQFEYLDKDGNWQTFTPSATDEPLLDSDKGTATDYEQISAVTTTSLTDDTKSDLKSDDGLDIVLTANRAAQKSGVDIQGLTNKSPLLWTEDATTASNWDLSRMGIGGVNANGTSAPTATQNTANCYIVRHPGSYKFPVVYGNGLQGGTFNLSGIINSSKLSSVLVGQPKNFDYTDAFGYYLPSFLNAYGEDMVPWTVKTGRVSGVEQITGIQYNGKDNLNDNNNANLVWIVDRVKGTHKINGSNVNVAENKIKAALLWCDEENMISSVSMAKTDNKHYISFSTADKDNLKPCNAVIVLYYDANDNSKFEPGASSNEIAFWSWHIWVTDAPFSDPTITVSGTTVDGTSVAGSYTFMSRDLGECDTPSKLYAMKEKWRKEISIRVKQVEGNAGYQYLTVKQPDLDAPGSPNAPYYQWGRKDPFPGKTNTDPTSTDSKTIYVGVGASTMPTETDPSTAKASVTQSIAHPQHFFTSSTDSRNLTNLWNMQSDLASDGSGTKYCSATKTIYDPCPYGYRVPTFKELFAIVQNNKTITADVNGQFVVGDANSRLSFSSFWSGAVLYPDVSSQDNNLVFTVLGCRDADDGDISHVGETNKYNTRPSSSLDSSHNFYYMALPGDNLSNSIYYSSLHDNGYPIRPIRE